MLSIAVIVASMLLLWSLVHWGFAWFFKFRIVGNRDNVPGNDSTYCPNVAVLLSLRGCDPSLQQNLRGLLAQTYENFEIIVVVDSRQDRAWSVAESIKSQHDGDDRLRIVELQNRSTKCSLKCSSLIQATEHLGPRCEAVVLVDADVVPHPDWLADAIAPLKNPEIGVVTGSQWFSPSGADPGSLLRSLWNAGSMVASAINANPWAGTCAMRLNDVHESGLIDIWKTSVVDDGPIKAAFAQLGLKVHFEPRLIMVNRDCCTTAFVGRYITRMLTWSRIYEKTFVNTVIHAMLMAFLLSASLVLLVYACLTKEWFSLALIGSSMLCSNLFMFAGFRTVEAAVNQSLTRRHGKLEPLRFAQLFRLFLLLPICQLAHVIWTMKAIFVRKVWWRNISYRLHPQQRVEMLAYQPYVIDQTTSPSRASI